MYLESDDNPLNLGARRAADQSGSAANICTDIPWLLAVLAVDLNQPTPRVVLSHSGTDFADWVEEQQHKANQTLHEVVVQSLQAVVEETQGGIDGRSRPFIAESGYRSLHSRSALKSQGISEYISETITRHVDFVYLDTAIFVDAFRKSVLWYFDTSYDYTVRSGISQPRFVTGDPPSKSLKVFTREVARLLAKKRYQVYIEYFGEPDDLTLAQLQAHHELQRTLLYKAAERAAARQQSRLAGQKVNWVLTKTAGNQTHKTYYMISPHRSIYVPEFRQVVSALTRNLAASETYATNEQELFKWKATKSRWWASISSPRNGLMKLN